MNLKISRAPERIVCLTEEPTEILYLLGEEHRIVGISAYTCRPLQAKNDKPVVSAFVNGSVSKIKALKPDLVIGFSDIQADLARSLIAENLQVLIFNQRSIQDILDVILMTGRIVSQEKQAQELVHNYINKIKKHQKSQPKHAPKVYFEEWDDPMISGIQWVSELIGIAGGVDIFSDRSSGKSAQDRFVKSEEVVQKNPDIYIGSWCGKPVNMDSVKNRPEWQQIQAVQNNSLYEMDPSIILQPGPACLTDGLDALVAIMQNSKNEV